MIHLGSSRLSEGHWLYHGDCLAMLAQLGDCTVDSCVTDPPYGLSAPPDIAEVLRHWLAGDVYEHRGRGFMGRGWDAFVPGPDVWREVYRVLKPGAHAVVFSGQRTVDLMGMSLRLAGFEVRETGGWAFWNGFPKSLGVSKAIDAMHGAEREVVLMAHRKATGRMAQGAGGYGFGEDFAVTAPATDDAKTWDGWGTATKPAIEPWILVRKPLSESSIARNVLRWGTGALNIDACRYAYGDDAWPGPSDEDSCRAKHQSVVGLGARGANGVAFGEHNAERFDGFSDIGRFPANIFACPKASTAERELGCEGLAKRQRDDTRRQGDPGGDNPRNRGAQERGNCHPTVKPLRLIRWLLRLVTPPGGVVVEPFAGSETLYVAAGQVNTHHGLGCTVVGSELGEDPGYIDIPPARYNGWARHGFPLEVPKGPHEQMTIWDACGIDVR